MGDGATASAGDLEINFQLENDMRQFTQDLQKWSAHQTATASSVRARHLEMIRQHKEQLATLTLHQQSLQETASSQNQSNAARLQQIAKLEQELTQLVEELNALPVSAQSASEALRLAKTHTELQQQELDAGLSEQNKRLRSLEQKVQAFQQRLGLSFQKVEGGLQVVYTLVDPHNADRACSFVVRITPENRYEIKDVSPALNPGELEVMVSQLNRRNNFAWFVQAIRQKFRALA